MTRQTLDLGILKIERAWGKEPGWFASLDRDRQIQLLALQRVENTPEKELIKKPDKRALIRQRIKEYQRQDQPA